MSQISKLNVNLSNLVDILQQYENDLIVAKEHLAIKGKTLEVANRENPSWQFFYDERRAELHTLVKYFDAQVERTRGKLFKSYTETYNRDLSDRAKDKYIDNEDAYLKIYEVSLEIKELHDKYQSICDAFRARGYALNNITKIRIAAIQDDTI